MDNQKPKKKPKESNLKNITRFSGIGIQMGATIFLGAYFGKWFDGKYPHDKNWFTILFTLLAVALSIYSVLQELKKYNDKN